MKKKLLVSVITFLCLAMTVPALLSVFFTAGQTGVATPSANANSLALSTLNSTEESTEESKEVTDFITGSPSASIDMAKKNPDLINFTGEYQVQIQLKGQTTNGYRNFKATGGDPYVYLIQKPPFPVKTGRFIMVTYRTYDAVGCDLQLYIGSEGEGASAETMLRQPLEVNEENDKTWRVAFFDTALIASTFYNGKNCKFFRLDPIEGIDANGKSIDIQKIEFYALEDIDYAAYQDYVAAEEAKKNQVDWPDPEFKEMETSADDHYAGSLSYTPSEDNSQMTISYKVGDKTVSYTVPNKNNYLFGGYVGTDDVGRELYTSTDYRDSNGNTIGVIGDNGERYVGLFYFLWLGMHPVAGDNNNIYNIQEIIDTYDPSEYLDHLGPAYAHHFYAEPLYGYYYSEDKWVMKKHAELLCNAGIDFLYLDATNANAYLSNAIQLMGVLHDLNEQGYDAPQVVFYTNSYSNMIISQVYDSIYKPGLYTDTWFCIDGKPVIVGTEDTDSRYGRTGNTDIDSEYKDYFYIKESQWPNEDAKRDAWPWMDFGWPQKTFVNAEGQRSAINVSVAQHSTTIAFGTSALRAPMNDAWGGAKINRGRSFNAGKDNDSTRAAYHTAWLTDPSLTNLGLNFQAQWDQAHFASERDQLEFVLVTGWNEWVAQYQKGKDSLFVDCASMEFSRDTEMMRGGYFDNYYMQLIQNVEKLKGDAPVIVQDARKPINVTGSFDQWNDVPVTYTDPMQDNADRNSPGFGGQILIDTTGRNDIVASKIVADTQNIYFYAKTRYDVSKYDKTSSWMQLFIDSDSDASTGWYGYDFIVNYRAKNDFTTTVAKYTGEKKGQYRFVAFKDVSFRAKDEEIMIAVPLEALGIDNYEEICFQFKWADSETKIETMEQFYTMGDAAPLGRLNYVFQNYIPESDVILPPETDTETDTESETESETESATETVSGTETEVGTDTSATEPAENNGGCGSVISTGTAALLLTAMAAAVALKKKED